MGFDHVRLGAGPSTEPSTGDASRMLSGKETAMATRKKAKGKRGAKRKKASVSKSTRRSTTKKAKAIRKKVARKAPVRAAPPKKARPIRNIAAKPAAISERAPKATPSRPPQPVSSEQRIGVVTHYYSHLSVATIKLEPGTTLRVGDVIHICGHTTDFTQRIESLEVNHAAASEVGPDDDFGLKVIEHAREHDVVFKARR
jgi:hypothetical protein